MKTSSDPPKTRSLTARSTTDGLTKKQRERQKRLEKAKQAQAISIPVQPKKNIFEGFSEETKFKRFAKGMGIREIRLDSKKNSVVFDLEPSFEHMLQTIASWNQTDPHTYLSQLLTEYLLKEKQKLN
jgi:hypothetical protein